MLGLKDAIFELIELVLFDRCLYLQTHFVKSVEHVNAVHADHVEHHRPSKDEPSAEHAPLAKELMVHVVV
jgi:hypothetical protein